MFKDFIGKWGFLIAGTLFLIGAIIPFAEGKTVNVAFFVIGIALLVVGSAVARKKRANVPPKR
jgi:LPXTG-motif cell wall-anchored protein